MYAPEHRVSGELFSIANRHYPVTSQQQLDDLQEQTYRFWSSAPEDFFNVYTELPVADWIQTPSENFVAGPNMWWHPDPWINFAQQYPPDDSEYNISQNVDGGPWYGSLSAGSSTGSQRESESISSFTDVDLSCRSSAERDLLNQQQQRFTSSQREFNTQLWQEQPQQQCRLQHRQVTESKVAHDVSERNRWDAEIVKLKNEKNMSYKDIKKQIKCPYAESTMRGHYRAATKAAENRVRKPKWRSTDVSRC